jgi:hypothetical protein
LTGWLPGVTESLSVDREAKKLIGVAIDAVNKERQKYAWDANLAKALSSDPPIHAVRSLEKYNEFSRAIELLEQLVREDG